MVRVVGWDFDGTIAECRGQFTEGWWERDPVEVARANWVPIYDNIERLKDHYRAGDYIVLITARPERLCSATREQLSRIGILHVFSNIVHQPAWIDDATAVNYKAQTMKDFQVAVYYGDSENDAKACTLAGVPFVHCPAPWV